MKKTRFLIWKAGFFWQAISRILYFRQPLVWRKRLRAASFCLPEAKRAASSPLLGISPGGVCRAFRLAAEAVSSYLAFSPLLTKDVSGIFSVALSLFRPLQAEHRALPGTLPLGVRTFLCMSENIQRLSACLYIL